MFNKNEIEIDTTNKVKQSRYDILTVGISFIASNLLPFLACYW